MTLRLIEQLEHRARLRPEAPAIRQVETPGAPARVVTRGELAGWVAAVAARLADAVPPAGVVLICAPNQPEFAAAFLGALAAGLRAFPVSPDLAEPELLAAAERSGAVAVIGTPATLAALGSRVPLKLVIDDVPRLPRRPLPSRPYDTAALLLLSSGTTGRPKIVVRDARSLDAVSDAMAGAIGFTEADHVLACVPLCHSYGIEHGLLAPTRGGSCVHLSRGFDLRLTLRELAQSGISIFPGVPFMFEMLARHAGTSATAFPALRRAYSAGGPLPRGVADAFGRAFGVSVAQLYGATEIGSVTFADPDLPGFDPASVGRPMKGASVRILSPDANDVARCLPPGEQGHVAVAAASMLSGYLGGDDAAAALTTDGYFLTGDLGRLDADGNLTVTGRLKLLIDVGGLKVNPVEVEEVMAQHPGVASCVVVPVRVSETVSRLKAIVTPRPDSAAAPPAAESLRRFARSRLTGYKVPRVFEIRDSLPKSPTGKILRHLVEA